MKDNDPEIYNLTSAGWILIRQAQEDSDKAGEQAGVDLAEREENRARIATLERIVDTGTCSTPPPIFGWLIENSLITENGFDMAKVRAMLDELRGV